MSFDRHAEGYEPSFDIDAEFGHQGELLVGNIVQSIQTGSIEVKRDGRWKDTGNIYVEYECRTRAGWRPSGIATTGSEMWAFVIGDPEVVLVIPAMALKDIAEAERKRGKTAQETDGSHPTKGVLISTQSLLARLRRPIGREAA